MRRVRSSGADDPLQDASMSGHRLDPWPSRGAVPSRRAPRRSTPRGPAVRAPSFAHAMIVPSRLIPLRSTRTAPPCLPPHPTATTCSPQQRVTADASRGPSRDQVGVQRHTPGWSVGLSGAPDPQVTRLCAVHQVPSRVSKTIVHRHKWGIPNPYWLPLPGIHEQLAPGLRE